MLAWLILLTLGAIWGASYLFIKIGGAEVPPFTFVALRTIIASLALLFALRLRRESLPRKWAQWVPLIGMGIFNGVVPYTLITWGELYISSGLAAILTAEPAPLSTDASGLPAELARIVSRCLRKAPEKRWQSIADVRIALEEWLAYVAGDPEMRLDGFAEAVSPSGLVKLDIDNSEPTHWG